jgi:carboxyl-terminal processing protease
MDDFENDAKDVKPGRSLVQIAVLFGVVAALSFTGGLTVGAKSSDVFSGVPFLSGGLLATPDAAADLSDFWKVWNVLSDRFVQTHGTSSPPTVMEKLWGAMEGLTNSYGDPYTVFMRPADAKIFQEDIAGNFSGVGMEVGVKEGILTVIAPLKGTPAERAGIRSGDQILMIDDRSTEGMSTDEAVKLIRGEKGSVVTFSMLRGGTERIEIAVVRDTIQVPTIETATENGVFVISFYSFTANSGSLFNRALAEFRQSGLRALLIDLRGNPGGYLESAVSVASHFLPDGAVVVTEDYDGNRDNIEHRSRGTGGIPAGTKVAILIDAGSASASEILAGALQDAGVATLVGTRSFGKGSVQELVKVGNASLKITVARWLTPSGRSISDGGLTPDIEVEATREEIEAGEDPQKARAIQFLTTGE